VFNSEEEAREYLARDKSPGKYQRLIINPITNEYGDFFKFAEHIIEDYNTADNMTKKNYLFHLKRFEKAGLMSGLSITDIEKIHGEKALAWLARQGVDGKPASYETVKGSLTVLKMITSRAYENDYIEKDVFKKLSLPGCVVKKKARKVVDTATWKNVVDNTKSEEFLYVYLVLIWTTGMRPGEARALSWSNVDFNRKEIKVCEAFKHKQEGEDGVGVTKTGVERVNILADELVPVLRKIKKNHDKKGFKRIFTNLDGSLITEYAIGNRLRKKLSDMVETGVIDKEEVFSAYNLRHTYITDLMKKGFTSSQVALLVGNSAEITDRTYNHSTSRDVMEILKKRGQRTKN
jgi:integrase